MFGTSRDVTAFSCGADALAHMEAHGVDVLLTDKNLPDVGGLELLGHAKRIQPDAEVLIITGYASLETAVAALQQGAFDYIVKPPESIFEVRRKVGLAFARQAMVRENRRLVEDLKRNNEALQEALAENQRVQAELIQSEKLAGIGTLAAGIAHEISSPLFGVMGLAEAIVDEDDLETIHGFANEIVDYSRAIKEIVVHLTGYSRDAVREFDIQVDAGAVLQDAASLVVRSMGLPEGLVVLDVPGDLVFRARTSEVQQIFVNLIKNAVEAAHEVHPEGGARVQVTARQQGDQVICEVSDNGPGIAEDDIKEIFDPFFTTKPPGKGTGLGLNIVYRLVTKYRGTVTVQSTVGEGTTFVVQFPSQAV